jgi:hypothetical protein
MRSTSDFAQCHDLPFFSHFSRIQQVYPIGHQSSMTQEISWAPDVVEKHQNTSFLAYGAASEQHSSA